MVLKHALIVEDDAVTTFLTAKVLKKYNSSIIIGTASNGAKALEYLKKHPVTQLVIFDLHMPVVDGFEFVRLLHEHNVDVCYSCLCALYTILKDEEKQLLISLSVTDFIEKPFTDDKLQIVLDRCFVVT